MKNQQTEMSSRQAKKMIGRKGIAIAGLAIGIIITIISFKFANGPSSRPSTPSEIDAQKYFQDKLMTAQGEFQQKVEAARIEAEQKSDSILKATEQM